jgi:hypothetical protein
VPAHDAPSGPQPVLEREGQAVHHVALHGLDEGVVERPVEGDDSYRPMAEPLGRGQAVSPVNYGLGTVRPHHQRWPLAAQLDERRHVVGVEASTSHLVEDLQAVDVGHHRIAAGECGRLVLPGRGLLWIRRTATLVDSRLLWLGHE